MNILKKIKLEKQILSIVVVSMIGFASVAATYLYSNEKHELIEAQQALSQESDSLTMELTGDFTKTRQLESEFLASADMKFVAEHKEVSEEMKPQITELYKYHTDQRAKDLIAEVDKQFTQYTEDFHEMVNDWRVIGSTPKEGLRGELNALGEEVNADLEKHIDLGFIFKDMRVDEKDFMNTLDPNIKKEIAEDVENFKKALAASNLSSEVKEEIQNDILEYQAAFTKVIDLRFELAADTVKMAKLNEELLANLSLIEEDSEADVAAAMKMAEEEKRRAVIEILSIMAVTSLIVLAIGVGIGRAISKPIVTVTANMKDLAEDKLDIAIPNQDYNNEIGDMARALEHFKEQLIQVKELQAEQARQKEITEAEIKRRQLEMADEFDNAVGGVIKSISSAVTELEASSTQMSSTATETSSQAVAVATAANEASANVETVSSAATELSSSIASISEQITQTAQMSNRAVGEAKSSTDKINGLNVSVAKISEVVDLINDIAEQTNLLALNATIEAARAGDMGKGFAVVANEVKNLASQTAKATEEIGSQISEVQTETKNAVEAIGLISKAVSEMNEISVSVASAVEEQASATNEISRNVEEAAKGTQEVSSNIVVVKNAANDTGAAATQIQNASKDLSVQSETLGVQVNKFLNHIRSGAA